jgi:hypothetical protein
MNRSGLLLAALSALALTGCPKPVTQYGGEQTNQDGPKVDPWDAVAKRLRKETDPAGVRGALGKLADDLASRPDAGPPVPLTPDAEKALAALARLAPEDLETVRTAAFGGADGAYVAECLYFRDAAQAVDPIGLPPADKARAGFAWVCRQVYLNPWVTDDGRFVPAVPPSYVLRRGWGTGYERATVALALFQQMGLDAGLVGPPDAGDKPVGFMPPWADPKGTPPGPFWAVAARAGADVLLFDPFGGRPFPGTLAQVKTNPDLLKAWADDKAHPWKVPADAVRQGTVFLSVPVQVLAPRMAVLEQKTKAELGVDLAVNLQEVRDRFAAAPPGGPGLADVKAWTPPGDGLAYPRVLTSFLPGEEGGADRRPSGQQLLGLYMRASFPRQMFTGADVLPRDLAPQPAKDRLVIGAAAGYEAAFLTAPTPRERMQRGQLRDATQFLSDRQDYFTRGQEQVRNATPEQVETWVKGVNAVYDALRQAEYPNPLQTQPNPPSDPAVAAARAAVDEFWRTNGTVAQAIIARATSRTGLAEATYLLALVKHEEAERQQLRAEKASGADAARAKATAQNAWAEAANAWRSYLEQSASLAGFPGRVEHARALAARAEGFATAKG